MKGKSIKIIMVVFVAVMSVIPFGMTRVDAVSKKNRALTAYKMVAAEDGRDSLVNGKASHIYEYKLNGKKVEISSKNQKKNTKANRSKFLK